MATQVCIFCDNELGPITKPEHILLSALGGKKTTRRADCSSCNEKFGNTIDKEVAEQVAILRSMLHLESGTGNSPPMLRKVKAGEDTVNIHGDGTIKPVVKPFTLELLGEGKFNLSVTAESFDEIAAYIPHIAAQIGCPEEHLVEQLKKATATSVHRRTGTVHHKMGFGGPLAIRSFVKSALVLWSTLVGNYEVKSTPYAAARHFVLHGDKQFVSTRTHLDSRFVPHVDDLKRDFGPFFNLIYVRSDDAGRVVGHFTLYNVLAWQFVLVESGGTPNLKTALVSNPTDTSGWSDTVAEQVDIDFDWLNNAEYPNDFARARQRLDVAIGHALKGDLSTEIDRITRTVFEKHGVPEGAIVTDPSLKAKILGEIDQRMALHRKSLPHEETLPGEEFEARLRAAVEKRSKG